MKGTYIYYLQADYGEGTALYNGFPAPQFPRVVAQLEERTGASRLLEPVSSGPWVCLHCIVEIPALAPGDEPTTEISPRCC